jgi:hypothetical protein
MRGKQLVPSTRQPGEGVKYEVSLNLAAHMVCRVFNGIIEDAQNLGCQVGGLD